MKTVPQTEYRAQDRLVHDLAGRNVNGPESYTESVPVTTYRQVVEEQGCYQTFVCPCYSSFRQRLVACMGACSGCSGGCGADILPRRPFLMRRLHRHDDVLMSAGLRLAAGCEASSADVLRPADAHADGVRAESGRGARNRAPRWCPSRSTCRFPSRKSTHIDVPVTVMVPKQVTETVPVTTTISVPEQRTENVATTRYRHGDRECHASSTRSTCLFRCR